MGRLFNAEGPVMSFLNKMADLMLLNLLTWLCCIPIITAGAAFTALHYMTLKIVRGEEGYIVKGYFKSFKQNFRQATLVWIVIILLACVFAGDYYILQYSTLEMPKVLMLLLGAMGFIYILMVMYVFPVLAKFENTVFNTIKNALLMSFISLPRAILMLVIYIVPAAIFIFFPPLIPVVFLLGISLPAYFAAKLYSGVLKKFEPQEDETNADNWVIPDSEEQKEGKDEQ